MIITIFLTLCSTIIMAFLNLIPALPSFDDGSANYTAYTDNIVITDESNADSVVNDTLNGVSTYEIKYENNAILIKLDAFMNLIFDNLGLLGFFLDIGFIKILLPLVLLVANAEHIYHLIMWIIRKIPALGMS